MEGSEREEDGPAGVAVKAGCGVKGSEETEGEGRRNVIDRGKAREGGIDCLSPVAADSAVSLDSAPHPLVHVFHLNSSDF